MRNITVLLMLIALCISTASQVQAQDVPGTAPVSALKAAPGPSDMTIKTLNPTITETGNISVSIDGCGANVSTCTIAVDKPAGATVRGAYFAHAPLPFFTGATAPSNILINGNAIPAWDFTVAQEMPFSDASNTFANVTSIVKPIVDAAAAGISNITITQLGSTSSQEGHVLVIIFDDPAAVTKTAVLSFGAQNTTGDSFAISLAEPFVDANIDITMSLAISYGFQTSAVRTQLSQIDVNGSRLTSSAGGQDDCFDFSLTNNCGNGELITVGGIGDDLANPVFPNAGPGNARTDDELYTLDSFINDGDTQILVETINPSNDDNIFLATFIISGTAAIIGEGIILTPLEAENPVGTTHTVTAKVQDDDGNPVDGRNVDFVITSGPNAGLMASATTDANGEATWTYQGDTAGTDVIVASFVDSNGETQTSNEATKTWVDTVMADCNDFVISNYQTLTDDIQFIDLTNVADAPIDTEGCSIISFNVFSETVIANASAALSGTVEPWATKTVFFEGDMPAGPGAFGLYEKPVPADGAPFNTDDEITGMVYLSNDMVFGVAHLTRPAYNDYYDCVYGGNGVGPFMRPFSDISSCKAPAKRASAVQGTSLRAMMRGVATSDLVQSDEQPERFALLQNYPNPFNPTTVIPFTMQENSHVSIKVYDLMGREIATLISEPMAAGQHSVEWNGRNSEGNLVPSGMYLYRMDAAGQTFTQRMTLVK